ncbi:MAG TPA: conjugal transfer protein [Solirubrobacteraceae bacterium]|nr:conjugal transfer protein [Solirubrobacteraceae bacterium]
MASTGVTVTPTPIWRLRLRRQAPRYMLQALAALGLLASARYAIDPPAPRIVHVTVGDAAGADRAAEGFAALFASRYLSFQAADPEAHRQALAPYIGAEMEPDAGFQPPEGISQRVLWTQVVAAEAQAGGRLLYTVAVQTEPSGLLYLSVGVVHTSNRALAITGYPAIVGAPPIAAAPSQSQLSEVSDGALTTVLDRALRNYLAGSESELAADLSAHARVAPPNASMALEAIQSLGWEPGGHSVLSLVRVRDRAGGRYTLAYRLYVLAAAGRWEVSGIELAPG